MKEVYNLPNDVSRCNSKVCPRAVDCARAYPPKEGIYPEREFKCYLDGEKDYFIELKYKK